MIPATPVPLFSRQDEKGKRAIRKRAVRKRTVNRSRAAHAAACEREIRK